MCPDIHVQVIRHYLYMVLRDLTQAPRLASLGPDSRHLHPLSHATVPNNHLLRTLSACHNHLVLLNTSTEMTERGRIIANSTTSPNPPSHGHCAWGCCCWSRRAVLMHRTALDLGFSRLSLGVIRVYSYRCVQTSQLLLLNWSRPHSNVTHYCSKVPYPWLLELFMKCYLAEIGPTVYIHEW